MSDESRFARGLVDRLLDPRVTMALAPDGKLMFIFPEARAAELFDVLKQYGEVKCDCLTLTNDTVCPHTRAARVTGMAQMGPPAEPTNVQLVTADDAPNQLGTQGLFVK